MKAKWFICLDYGRTVFCIPHWNVNADFTSKREENSRTLDFDLIAERFFGQPRKDGFRSSIDILDSNGESFLVTTSASPETKCIDLEKVEPSGGTMGPFLVSSGIAGFSFDGDRVLYFIDAAKFMEKSEKFFR